MSIPTRALAWQRAVGAQISSRGQRFIKHIPRLGIDESTLLLIFAVIIGAAVGVAVIGFYKLIDIVQAGALTAGRQLTVLGILSILVVVIAGIGLTRYLVRYAAGDSDGENIPDVMRAVAKRGGFIHMWPVVVKTVGSALAIGTGGSVGAEGPVAVAGSALGSRIGRFFRSGPARLKVLVACGAAAGISAAFNAPIAGVFFSLEKVIGTLNISAFPPVLVASVIAAAISRAAFGDSPVIEIPTQYGVGSASELLLYALLGVATGIVAVLYTRGVYKAVDMLEGLKYRWRQVLAAGLVVGALDIAFREDLWGRGHETLSLVVISESGALFLLALAFAKLVVTAATLAVTRVGGVFTPALFIGATIGGGLAAAAAPLLGAFDIVPEAFALVGMAGLVAGSTHAPLTAIMIVFEMTNDYALILPLMLCGAIAYITARRLYENSVYSEWLVRKGERIVYGQDTSVLERLRVSDCYNRDPHVIGESATADQILKAIGTTAQMEFPVIDSKLRFIGMINYEDLRTVLAQSDTLGDVVLAADIASEEYETVTPNDSLRTALQRIALRGRHFVPVVDAADEHKLLGIIGRPEIFAAYDRQLLRS